MRLHCDRRSLVTSASRRGPVFSSVTGCMFFVETASIVVISSVSWFIVLPPWARLHGPLIIRQINRDNRPAPFASPQYCPAPVHVAPQWHAPPGSFERRAGNRPRDLP